MPRRKSEAGWRTEVIEKRGRSCRVCGSRDVEIDHMIPKGMGGSAKLTTVENGLPLCHRHHREKTEHTLKIQRRWLDPDQLDWLALEGYCRWDESGMTWGSHRNLFQEET